MSTAPKSAIGTAAGLSRKTINLPFIGTVSLGAIVLIGGFIYLIARRRQKKIAIVSI